jgi:hypothetical protein
MQLVKSIAINFLVAALPILLATSEAVARRGVQGTLDWLLTAAIDSSSDKLRQPLLQAKSIIYLKRVNRGGRSVRPTGIADAIAAKTVAMTGDSVGGTIVKGEAALGTTAIT